MSKILVISHVVTHPAISGNRARVNSLLTELQRAGHEISFFLINTGKGDINEMANCWDRFWSIPYKQPAPNLKRRIFNYLIRKLRLNYYLPYKADDWYSGDLNMRLKIATDGLSFDVILVEYIFYSKALENFSNCLKIIDTHDIFGDRHKLFLKNGEKPTWFYTTRKEEKRALKRADSILAIQNKELNYFKSLVPDKDVLTVGHITKIHYHNVDRQLFNRLLFVGSDNQVNFHSLSYFLSEIWPLIYEKLSNIQFDIVGNICNLFDRIPEGCNAYGIVDDLSTFYEKTDIVVNPVLFGTGLKIKNIEAMGYGLPLVTTSAGAEGLEKGSGTAFVVADSPVSFLNEICKIFDNKSYRDSLSSNAVEYAKLYNRDAINPILELIDNYKDK